ncbi:hypothetical protein GSI_03483 [Ganoderma sinense ZZ0214-1]|uniref:Uncharacterized protein n=1 Tax=Ganoderma sinense ZZ0214-1 TaxID=1077348 RepID=A0A2G8SLU9_9APHY|nr:hypothetical protein GSI_03483 [Ganoderma sinense ZZ0214-1]
MAVGPGPGGLLYSMPDPDPFWGEARARQVVVDGAAWGGDGSDSGDIVRVAGSAVCRGVESGLWRLFPDFVGPGHPLPAASITHIIDLDAGKRYFEVGHRIPFDHIKPCLQEREGEEELSVEERELRKAKYPQDDLSEFLLDCFRYFLRDVPPDVRVRSASSFHTRGGALSRTSRENPQFGRRPHKGLFRVLPTGFGIGARFRMNGTTDVDRERLEVFVETMNGLLLQQDADGNRDNGEGAPNAIMVAIKYYAPIVAACLSLCTGVAASVIADSEHHVGGNLAGVDLSSAHGALASPSSSSDESAVSNRAAAADIDASPITFGGSESGSVPGTRHENHALVAVTRGVAAANTSLLPNGLSLQNVTDICTTTDKLAGLLADLFRLTPALFALLTAAFLEAGISIAPGSAGDTTGTLSGLLSQSTSEIQCMVPLLTAALGSGGGGGVPANVTAQATTLVALVEALLPVNSMANISSDLNGSVTGLVACLTGLLPVLLALVADLGALGL